MSSTAIVRSEERNFPALSTQAMESLVVYGDLNKLTPADRLAYYGQRCIDLGLDPLSKPFDLLILNGKMVLYANKGCFEQLRASKKISISIVARERFDDLFVVTARALQPDGRQDEATGAVNLTGLKGENAANAIMKAETKAKRRVTLSLCGLGMLDETEVDSIPGAARVEIDGDGNLIGEQKEAHGHKYMTIWKDIPVTEHIYEQGSHDYCKACAKDFLKLSDGERAAFAAAYTQWLKTGQKLAAFPESEPPVIHDIEAIEPPQDEPDWNSELAGPPDAIQASPVNQDDVPVYAGPVISEPQAKRLYAISKTAKWSTNDLKKYLNLKLGIEHSRDIPKTAYKEVCEEVEKGIQSLHRLVGQSSLV